MIKLHNIILWSHFDSAAIYEQTATVTFLPGQQFKPDLPPRRAGGHRGHWGHFCLKFFGDSFIHIHKTNGKIGIVER